MSGGEATANGFWQRATGPALAWARRHKVANKLAFTLALAAFVSAAATYAALSETPPFGHDPTTVGILLNTNLVLFLLLGTVIARRIVALWVQRRRGAAGSRLHVRLVWIFSALAALPAIIMAIFAAIFLYAGVQAWFGERVSTAVKESMEVAEAYLSERQQAIQGDALYTLDRLRERGLTALMNQQLLVNLLFEEARIRSYLGAMLFDGQNRIYGQVGVVFQFDLGMIPAEQLERARRGEPAVLVSDNGDRVTAIIRHSASYDTFLMVVRRVEARVLDHMEATRNAVDEYRALETKRFDLQTQLTAVFVGIAFLMLLAAVWAGLNFATRLVRPIGILIAAAERVRAGDLTVRVPEGTSEPEDELLTLSRAFNRMTQEIETQRGELVEANRQLDLRRRFTEAVLSGVSAGVIGLDQDARINLPNLSAVELLGLSDPDAIVGERLLDIAPEMGELMQAIRRRPGKLVQGQVQLRRGNQLRTLLVRIAAEMVGDEIKGYVVTFDDVSELLAAQRKAAWADVARRIAHEIKNPLTPIQLSAERLRRKYLKEIESDPETFRAMTDTIVRHVDDIGRMVDEFSAFARMPSPVMKPANLVELARQTLFLQSTAHTAIRFETRVPAEPATVVCDSRQIGQALTNLLKNAVEAIEAKAEAAGTDGREVAGTIVLRLDIGAETVTLAVEDDGRGLPVEERDRLTEPYVTTRAKGTGLGLAIVKKIMEDHAGTLSLEDRPGGGARVSLTLPRTRPPSEPSSDPSFAAASSPRMPELTVARG